MLVMFSLCHMLWRLQQHTNWQLSVRHAVELSLSLSGCLVLDRCVMVMSSCPLVWWPVFLKVFMEGYVFFQPAQWRPEEPSGGRHKKDVIADNGNAWGFGGGGVELEWGAQNSLSCHRRAIDPQKALEEPPLCLRAQNRPPESPGMGVRGRTCMGAMHHWNFNPVSYASGLRHVSVVLFG